MTPEQASEIVSRFFDKKRQKEKKEIAVGIWNCPVCNVWTDDPSKHDHEGTPLD